MPSLQSQFLKSKGRPIDVDGQRVALIDRILARAGVVTVTFVSRTGERLQGVALKSPNGWIELSDGRKVSRLNIWDEPHLPRVVTHAFDCPSGELRVWNIYKASAIDDRTKSDAWTNNAGMIVDELPSGGRRYRCSDGIGDFCPSDLVFEVSIES